MEERKVKNKKPIIIFISILVAFIVLAIIIDGVHVNFEDTDNDSVASNYGDEFIAQLNINGEITNDSSSVLSSNSYDQTFLLNTIDELIDNDNNKGLLLFVNSPGGGVYATDELYLKIKEYEDETRRPVYVNIGEMGASGGYYLAAAADKITINRNGITGSIGVRLNTIYDFSGLLEKYDIKHVNIVSGKNKAMGSSVDTMTKEQKKIYQSVVDEAFDQFVGVVADGRNMSEKEVLKLADGRIYTAKQSLDNGLVDQVATLDETIDLMKQKNNLSKCKVKEISPEASSKWEQLLGTMNSIGKSSKSDIANIFELEDKENEFGVSYLFE